VAWPALAPLFDSAQRTFQRFWSPATDAQPWGDAGSAILPATAQVMASRNPPGQAMDDQQKKYLRLMFGDLVDQVQVNYNAKLTDRWSSGDQKIHIGVENSTAQAFCDRIYLQASYQPGDTRQLISLAHELTHFQQCLQLGGIQNFGSSYFQAYYRANQKYADNQFEKEARANAQQFITTLCQQINCRNPSGKYYINYQGTNTKLPMQIND
jgi:hypothetical protein